MKPAPDAERLLKAQTEAAKILVEQITESGMAEDSDLIRDMVEGSTSLLEAIEKVVASIVLEDEVQLEGLAKYAAYITDRKKALEARIERKKAMIQTAMQIAEQRTLKTALKTVSLKAVAPKLEVTDESQIPASYWKVPVVEPSLDRKAILDHLKAREKAREEAAKIPDQEARARMWAAIDQNMPEIPGATLSNGTETVQFR